MSTPSNIVKGRWFEDGSHPSPRFTTTVLVMSKLYDDDDDDDDDI